MKEKETPEQDEKVVSLEKTPADKTPAKKTKSVEIEKLDAELEATRLTEKELLLERKKLKVSKTKKQLEKEREKSTVAITDVVENINVDFADFTTENRRAFVRTHNRDSEVVSVFFNENFTENELLILGRNITQEICLRFSLKSVRYFTITREFGNFNETEEETRKFYSDEEIEEILENGDITEVHSSEKDPIFFFDYGKFGKIYRPKAEKNKRFRYFGVKPDKYFFAETHTKRFFESYIDGNKVLEDDKKITALFLCTGASDAMNLFAAVQNHNTYQNSCFAWLNSEQEYLNINYYKYQKFVNCFSNIYYIPDIDKTGIRIGETLALKYLELRIVWLPQSLINCTSQKTCKDLKDFVMFYRTESGQSINEYLISLINHALNLRLIFKDEILINNIVYFLKISGFGIVTNIVEGKKVETFVRTINNIVYEIEEEHLKGEIIYCLREFAERHSKFDWLEIINKLAMFAKFTPKHILTQLIIPKPKENYFFFRNFAWRISKTSITQISYSNLDFPIWHSQIIKIPEQLQNFSPQLLTEPLFSVTENNENTELLKRFSLSISETAKHFSLMRFLINSSNFYKDKSELTESDKDFNRLAFISKLLAWGYILDYNRNRTKAYAIYALEAENNAFGGGGKSLFCRDIPESVFGNNFIDGTNLSSADAFPLDNYRKGLRCYALDEIPEDYNLEFLKGMVTGDLRVNIKHQKSLMVPFTEACTFLLASNHSDILKLAPPLRDRFWFLVFSNYYTRGDEAIGKIKKWTPRMEFGKNLITDYNESEMNLTYNLFAQCLQLWLQIYDRVSIGEDRLVNRSEENLLKGFSEYFESKYGEITDENYEQGELFDLDKNDEYADRYFEFDSATFKSEILPELRDYLPNKKFFAVTKPLFRDRLAVWCKQKGFVLNPNEKSKGGAAVGLQKDGRVMRNVTGMKKMQEWFVIRYYKISVKL